LYIRAHAASKQKPVRFTKPDGFGTSSPNPRQNKNGARHAARAVLFLPLERVLKFNVVRLFQAANAGYALRARATKFRTLFYGQTVNVFSNTLLSKLTKKIG
jgi:hypothetical protein